MIRQNSVNDETKIQPIAAFCGTAALQQFVACACASQTAENSLCSTTSTDVLLKAHAYASQSDS